MSRLPTSAEPSDPIAPATIGRMARTAQRDNSAERALRSELHRRGLRFRIHRKILEGTRRPRVSAPARRRIRRWVFLARLSATSHLAEEQCRLVANENREQRCTRSRHGRSFGERWLGSGLNLGARGRQRGGGSCRGSATSLICPTPFVIEDAGVFVAMPGWWSGDAGRFSEQPYSIS